MSDDDAAEASSIPALGLVDAAGPSVADLGCEAMEKQASIPIFKVPSLDENAEQAIGDSPESAPPKESGDASLLLDISAVAISSSDSTTKLLSENGSLQALPQPQAPPAAPQVLQSEEIIISADDAPVIVTTTSAPPTMTPALSFPATLQEAMPHVPISSTQPSVTATTAATSPTPETTPAIAASTMPSSLQQVRANGTGAVCPTPGTRCAKAPPKAPSSERPSEPAVAENSDSFSKRPLTLLELPIDILRLIVKEITHTNDLTSLALTNSTLYALAVPHIYSRFDIVWPDPSAPASEGKSVDALTYGLSTLCLGSSFARTTHRLRNNLRRVPNATRRNGGRNALADSKFSTSDYAKYIRKFSLGNGPPEWVVEYMINKESGKMLGTLVALCVSKMCNLENFVWDMPTGVVSDVFLALASLPDFDPEHNECKLERLWIRWHNNTETSPIIIDSGLSSPTFGAASNSTFAPVGSNLTSIGVMLPPHSIHPQPRPAIPYSSSNVEFPTFSVVPPVRSLTVLDIDEIAYLDEMAILIEQSASRLNELRVGIASHATHKDFVQTWDGSGLQQVDLDAYWPGESKIGDRRLGGILGILVGRLFDIRRKPSSKNQFNSAGINAPDPSRSEAGPGLPDGTEGTSNTFSEPTDSPHTNVPSLDAPTSVSPRDAVSRSAEEGNSTVENSSDAKHIRNDGDALGSATASRLDKKLRLSTLELERVPLSMRVMIRALDWTTITTLTILGCPHHESLWVHLRKHFKPTPAADHGYGIAIMPPTRASSSPAPLRYQLALKSIHTDGVCKALLSFIRDTLERNSLEVLFLQDRGRSNVPLLVTMQDIVRNAVKPHCSSLKKLLIDGNVKTRSDNLKDHRHRRGWDFSSEIMTFLTSGRMAHLRELSFSLHYDDWHTFLQSIPTLTQLRSLHINHITDHVMNPIQPHDLAMQIANIVTLRPDVQLCFVAIGPKCYEVVEASASDNDDAGLDMYEILDAPVGSDGNSILGATDTSSSDDDDEDDDVDGEDSDGDEDGHQHSNGVGGMSLSNEPDNNMDNSDGERSESGFSDNDSLYGEASASRRSHLRMREIFFYDDKVAIFKARHGRL